MGPQGFEQGNAKPENKSTYEKPEKSTVQNPVHSTEISPDLLKLAQAIATLPEHIKQQIIKLVVRTEQEK